MKEKTQQQKKSGFKIAGQVLSYAFLAIALALLITALVAKFRGEPFKVFGYSFHLVVTDSMTGEIEKDDFIIAVSADIDDIVIGKDAVVFKAQSGPLKGQYIVHRAVKKEVIDGVTVLWTQGVKPGAPVDRDPVSEISGKFVWRSATIGAVMKFLTNPINLIFLVIVILLGYVAYRILRYMIAARRADATVAIDTDAQAESGEETTATDDETVDKDG